MKTGENIPRQVKSISALHSMLHLKGPANPLVSVINQEDIQVDFREIEQSLSYNFYIISLKKNFEGKVKYGQQYYDFDQGVMTFIAPGQVLSVIQGSPTKVKGYLVVVHPDFFAGYELTSKIRNYGFFSYSTNEALHLSESEEKLIVELLKNLDKEICLSIDRFTQDLIVSHLDMLLNYANRFYGRQFITRRIVNENLVVKFEKLLHAYYNSDQLQISGMPTVQYVAEQLHLSPNYLSDMLRNHTGQSTKQHIQDKLIERAKEMLSNTSLSISEIAYSLGFEYPQSFNKLFKGKTSQSPLKFRQSLN